MKYLTVKQVLFVHHLSIKRFGGSSGIRDVGLIQSAVARPQASFSGKDLYKNIFYKSATLLQSLLKNHAFVDGNKRTALASAGIFLKINGYKLINTHKQEIAFAIKVGNQNLTLKQIANWLKKNSRKI